MDNVNNPNSTLTSSLSQPIISPNDTCIPQLKVSDATNKTIYTIPMPAYTKSRVNHVSVMEDKIWEKYEQDCFTLTD